MVILSDPKSREDWHRIYCWWPRRVGRYLVWLDYVWASYGHRVCNEDFGHWEYRFAPDIEATDPDFKVNI